mmetsp:Transcript_76567/g.236462  ORF Transcript_76567/g.236462 Transcript_76567/m.236462 type:complete len:235 (-) Transcript_76567:48-752(-)
MAVRSAPNQQGEVIATVPAGAEYMATGRVGDYLQVRATQNGSARSAYVLHTLGGLVLLVPARAQEKTAELEEVWSPPRKYVCADTYPAGAQMAARAAPSQDGQQVATLPPGTEYLASGRVGQYLQVSLEIDGTRTLAYVLHSIGELTLLVPEEPSAAPMAPAAAAAAAAVEAAGAARVAAAAATAATDTRVEALEAKVAQQDRQIQALQSELAMLKAQLSAVASAFRPFAVANA